MGKCWTSFSVDPPAQQNGGHDVKRIGLLGGMRASTSGHYRPINELVSDRLGGPHSDVCLPRPLDFAAVEGPILDATRSHAERAVHLALRAGGIEGRQPTMRGRHQPGDERAEVLLGGGEVAARGYSVAHHVEDAAGAARAVRCASERDRQRGVRLGGGSEEQQQAHGATP
jgi:hypothetical protein